MPQNPDKFDILIQDLERIRVSGAAVGMFGEDSHSYELNPSLTDEEVDAFELGHGIRLPRGYREFLTRVGNGGAGPYYGLFRLGEMDDGFDFGPWDRYIGKLSQPFSHTAAWNDLSAYPDDQHDVRSPEYHKLIEAFDAIYYDTRLTDGAIPICHLGCALRQWLVITGPEAGYIWCDNRAEYEGLRPLSTPAHDRVAFFEWYRSWLDEALAKLQLWDKNSSS